MAKIIEKTNQLTTQIKDLQRKKMLMIVALVICILLLPLMFLSIIPIPFIIGLLKSTSNEIRQLNHGLKGERTTLNQLASLPDTFFVLPDLTISVDGLSSQIDTVVVGPSGIFIIETKNLVGKITGTLEDKQWTQTKTDRYGNEHKSTFYNPVKQVNTHVFRLSQLLKKHHLSCWVQGTVYFASREALINIGSADTPVFSALHDSSNLLSYIISYNAKIPISPSKQQDIINLLKPFQSQ